MPMLCCQWRINAISKKVFAKTHPDETMNTSPKHSTGVKWKQAPKRLFLLGNRAVVPKTTMLEHVSGPQNRPKER
jgi:hypothetical protein